MLGSYSGSCAIYYVCAQHPYQTLYAMDDSFKPNLLQALAAKKLDRSTVDLIKIINIFPK